MFSNDVVGAAESVCWSALAASAASASERVFGVSWEGVEEAKGKDDECDGEEARAERVLRRVVSPIVVFGCGCGCGWVVRTPLSSEVVFSEQGILRLGERDCRGIDISVSISQCRCCRE